MTISLYREPGNDPPTERCCICRDKTVFWSALPDRTPGQQVACCPHCASRANPNDIPTKTVWMRRERIAHHPTIGEISTGRDRVYPPAPVVPNQETP